MLEKRRQEGRKGGENARKEKKGRKDGRRMLRIEEWKIGEKEGDSLNLNLCSCMSIRSFLSG